MILRDQRAIVNIMGAPASVVYNYHPGTPPSAQCDGEERWYEITELRIAGSDDIHETDLCDWLSSDIYADLDRQHKEY